MASHRAHVVLPEDLAKDIDELAGERGRSAFIVEAMRREVRRLRLLEFLNNPEPIWKDEDHPELKNGAAAWVHEMRRAKSPRQLRIQRKLAEHS